MKAVLWPEYGPPEILKIGEVNRPNPKKNEVLIKIHAATVTAGDCEIRKFEIHPLFWLPVRIIIGIRKPRGRLLGQEFSGEIVEIGSEVTNFKVGDKVFGGTGINMGTYAQYRCQKASVPLAIKPDAISYDEAATITTGGINGMHFLRNAAVKAGSKVLINGAGGSIGTYALQIAKNIGAEVTCVDKAEKLEMLQSLGADHVIDYQKEDFANADKTYDAIIDIFGNTSYSRCLSILNSNGRYILGNPSVSGMLRSIWTSITNTRKVIWNFADDNVKDLDHLKKLMEDKKIKSFIDKTYPLEDVVAAHRYVEEGRKKGNIVIKIEHSD